jgi:predicted dehydrogenase
VKLGAEAAVDPTHAGCEDTVRDLCHGAGADAVIVTAGAVTAEPLTFACRVCRKKGKVVLVGDVPIEIARSEIYEKELDFLISSSYGPGRYDTSYEEDGRDYPRAYVRWTENRNMQAYLEALASATVSLAEIVAEPSSIEGAAETYSLLQQRDGPLCAIFSYGDDDGAETVVPVPIIRGKPVPVGRLGVAVIGTGAFARAVHLPNLQRLKADCSIQCVVSRTGATAVDVARVYGAAHAETDPERVFDDPSIDAVIVTSRHDSHADLVLSALRSGKAVLVEKPLCLTRSELEAIRFQCQGKSDTPLLLTGFNRRFAPLVIELATILENRVNPVVINYTVNAGFIAGDSWVHGSTGGGRNIGEACHIYDLFTFLVGGKLTRMSAISAAFGQSAYSFTDNFVATARFDDGSVATLTYTALGNASFSKERMEVFVDGAVLVLDDFKSLCSYGGKPLHLSRRRQDKGHFNELQSFVRGIRTGEWPAPLWQQLQAMEMAFAVEDCIRGTV